MKDINKTKEQIKEILLNKNGSRFRGLDAYGEVTINLDKCADELYELFTQSVPDYVKQHEKAIKDTEEIERLRYAQSVDIEKIIKFLTSNGTEKLRCPRCGWQEGKAWHCGLCEGHVENITDWYKSNLQSKEIPNIKNENELLNKFLTDFRRIHIGYPNNVVIADSHRVDEQLLRLIFNWFKPLIHSSDDIINECVEVAKNTNTMFFKSGTPQEELDKAYTIRKVLRDEIISNLLALKTKDKGGRE